MKNFNLEEVVKRYPIESLDLGMGKNALKNAGVKTVGEVIELIENEKINLIKGIGLKSRKSIESNIKQKIEMLENEISKFNTLPPEKEKWRLYLRLATDIFGKYLPEESINGEEIVEELQALTPRQKRVIELRFGFVDNTLWKLTEVGVELNVSKEMVRMIESSALRKLRLSFNRKICEKKARKTTKNEKSIDVLKFDSKEWQEYNKEFLCAKAENDIEAFKKMALENEDWRVIRYIKDPEILAEIALHSKNSAIVRKAFRYILHLKNIEIWNETYNKLEDGELKYQVKADREKYI